MDIYKPEISELLRMVEKKYAKPLDTTTDFEEFSYYLKQREVGLISASTLKRLWGYVNDLHDPRIITLNMLANYIGYENFKAFCEYLKTSTAYNSSFFTAEQILAKDLEVGSEVEIGWAPNRFLRLLYKGDGLFEVLEAKESKLQVGDCFETASFIKGHPLFLPYVLRDGKRTVAFIAGRNGGLTFIKCLHHA